jgi:hypothetical protein
MDISNLMVMNKKELEGKLLDLKAKQAAHFKKKKAERNAEELTAIRQEMNDLKQQARALYRPATTVAAK